jgi:4-diphosphocytidyl-2-C-methyl-D-erythritol kinase
VRLTKRIPVAAGLGGGSSDAASALALFATEWGVPLASDELRELALRIGSDVPFFASGAAAALVTGRGETVRPVPPARGNPGVLLVLPADRLATADVFAAWDRIRPPNGHARTAAEVLAQRLTAGLSAAALSEAAAALAAANDLWPAAVVLSPGLAEVRNAAEAALVRPMLMSGSGPALVAVYPSVDEAASAARGLSSERPAPLRDATIIATDTRTPTPLWRDP